MENSYNTVTVGVDVGGSHITAGVIDLAAGLILNGSVIREKLDTQGSLDEILDRWATVIHHAFSSSGKSNSILKLGMAMPGPFDYEDGVSLMVGQNKYDAFYGHNIKQLLANRLNISKTDILMMNDASCFLKGEVYGGVAKGYEHVIGLTLGTGLGSAKYSSSFTYDAELWCHPFMDGIVEDYLSTRWFVSRFKDHTGLNINDVKELSLYVNSNVYALEVFKEFGRNLGAFLCEFINMENPQVVVLGGNIANAFDLFISECQEILQSRSIRIPILRSVLGEDASLIGAASLWANILV
ncbi:ROK family protein [Pedobacter sp. BS3]|uniref:ROK family protein n=1 Tax=Pedobacter sp. BS3 TaxID=2567937 RepID=UPI0011ED201C|nr:ROK family protein [Pedobacter sp. BS3]TZF81010.1 ROK family protein [Pedobacter sp. BS3]